MQTQDYYKPRDLRNSLFDNLQLGEESMISIKKNYQQEQTSHHQPKKNNKNKYEEPDQEGDFDIGDIKEISILSKNSNNTISTQILSNNPKNQNYKRTSRASRRQQKYKNKNNNKKKQQKQEINIDDEIGQVAQWGEKGIRKNDQQSSQQSDVANQQYAQQTAQTIQIKKRLEDKLKILQSKGGSKTKPGGLKAKAQQLRIKNQQAQKKNKQSPPKQTNKVPLPKQEIKQIQEQQSQDYWDKINNNTMKQTIQKKQNQQELTHQYVIKYYQQLNIKMKESFAIEDEDQPQVGCFAMFCGCLNQKKNASLNMIQKQIIGLAQTPIQNTKQQNYLFKNIWEKLTQQKYARFGDHWNQIGFQGRDPATDLRSSGVLSLLQWYLFINSHEQYAIKIINFSKQTQLPAALSHIKITSMLVSLVRANKIHGQNWNQLQTFYNSFVYSFFEKCFKFEIHNSNVGEIVEKNIGIVKKNPTNAMKIYIQWKSRSSK